MFKSLRFKLSILKRNRRAFMRWAWLRLTGRTAYRFSPLYKTEMGRFTQIGGAPEIRQANGLILPERTRPPTDPTLRADVAAAWEAAYGPKHRKRRK